eukprot:6912638-Prymnesium_polylepis.2
MLPAAGCGQAGGALRRFGRGAPPREPCVLQRRQHQPGVATELDALDRLESARHEGRHGERAALPKLPRAAAAAVYPAGSNGAASAITSCSCCGGGGGLLLTVAAGCGG